MRALDSDKKEIIYLLLNFPMMSFVNELIDAYELIEDILNGAAY